MRGRVDLNFKVQRNAQSAKQDGNQGHHCLADCDDESIAHYQPLLELLTQDYPYC